MVHAAARALARDLGQPEHNAAAGRRISAAQAPAAAPGGPVPASLPPSQEAEGMPAVAAVQSLLRSVTIPWGSKSTPNNVGLASNTEVTTLRNHKQRLYLFQSPGNPQWQVGAGLGRQPAACADGGRRRAALVGGWRGGRVWCSSGVQQLGVPAGPRFTTQAPFLPRFCCCCFAVVGPRRPAPCTVALALSSVLSNSPPGCDSFPFFPAPRVQGFDLSKADWAQLNGGVRKVPLTSKINAWWAGITPGTV